MTLALASTVLSSNSGESLTNRAYRLVILIALVITLAVGLYLLFSLTGIGNTLFGSGSILGSAWSGTKFVINNFTPIGWLFTVYSGIGSSSSSWVKFRNFKTNFYA